MKCFHSNPFLTFLNHAWCSNPLRLQSSGILNYCDFMGLLNEFRNTNILKHQNRFKIEQLIVGYIK